VFLQFNASRSAAQPLSRVFPTNVRVILPLPPVARRSLARRRSAYRSRRPLLFNLLVGYGARVPAERIREPSYGKKK